MSHKEETQKAFDDVEACELALTYFEIVELIKVLEDLLESMSVKRAYGVLHFSKTKEKVGSHVSNMLKIYRLKSMFHASCYSFKSGAYKIDLDEENKALDKFHKKLDDIFG